MCSMLNSHGTRSSQKFLRLETIIKGIGLASTLGVDIRRAYNFERVDERFMECCH